MHFADSPLKVTATLIREPCRGEENQTRNVYGTNLGLTRHASINSLSGTRICESGNRKQK